MKDNLTEIIFIIDKSGSMVPMSKETVDGYNKIIDDQRDPSLGEAKITMTFFNSNVEFVYDNVDIKEIKPLTLEDYKPYGYTSLLDAIGLTFNRVGQRLANTPENERPSRVVVFILTDGEENSSKEFDRNQIADMIKEQTEKYSWVIDFMGTTDAAIKDAHSYNIHSATKFVGTKQGLTNALHRHSLSICSYRTTIV